MTYNTFNYLNDHIHIHIPSNTHKFLFFGVTGIGRNFWGGLCQFGCNIGSIQLEHLTSFSINEACRGSGDEYRDLRIQKNQVNLLQITTTMLPLPIKSTHFNCCQAAVIIPSLHRNAHWNCLLLILNISKKLLSFITKKFWLYHIQY